MILKSKNATALKVISHWRNLQIDILDGRQFNINDLNYKDFLKSDKYKAYSKFTPNEILTGSSALRIFGLLDRPSNDLDIIVKYPLYPQHKYGRLFNRNSYSEESLDNYIGSKNFEFRDWFIKKQVTFDFFNNNDTQFIQLSNNLKVELPLSIIKNKIEIADRFGMIFGEKHTLDLFNIFGYL